MSEWVKNVDGTLCCVMGCKSRKKKAGVTDPGGQEVVEEEEKLLKMLFPLSFHRLKV